MTNRDVYRLLDQGLLGEDEPLELIHGSLIEMSPQSPAHAFLSEEIARLVEAVATRASATRASKTADDPSIDPIHTRTHSPLHVDAYNEPEPDVALVRGRPRDYAERHPAGDDCLLVVEIARVRSRARAKLGLYAHAGVPEVWIVDLERRRVEAHREPVAAAPGTPGHRGASYRRASTLRPGRQIIVPCPDPTVPATRRRLAVGRLLP